MSKPTFYTCKKEMSKSAALWQRLMSTFVDSMIFLVSYRNDPKFSDRYM